VRRPAAGDLKVDGRITAAVAAQQFGEDVRPALGRVRVGDARFGQAALQARDVRVKAQVVPAVGRDHLVHAIAIDEAAVERVHARLRQRHEGAVEMDRDVGLVGQGDAHGLIPATTGGRRRWRA
jgi:hypothetical protein